MGVSRARVASALVCAAIVASATAAHADEPEHTKSKLSKYVRQFTIGYERLPLSVGDSTFWANGAPSHTGKELGFISPIAQVLDMRCELGVSGDLVVVLDSFVGGWAKSDTVATDPYVSRVTGDIVVVGSGVGLGDVLRLGDHVVVRGDFTLGFQMPQIPVWPHPSRRNSGINAFQIFVRPRVALEVPLSDIFALGAFVSDDVVRPGLVAFGGYVGITPW
jgi:hypothetical protein